MLPCCLLLTSAVINFPDVPLTPQLLCSNSTAPSASSFLLSFLCIPLFYPLLSHLLSYSCIVPSSLLQVTPVHRSVHHEPLTDCTCIHQGEVLHSSAHNNNPLAVIFHECLSCCCVSVLCWCFTTCFLCFATHYLLLPLCASFPTLRPSHPEAVVITMPAPSFVYCHVPLLWTSCPFLPPASEPQIKLVCFKILKK